VDRHFLGAVFVVGLVGLLFIFIFFLISEFLFVTKRLTLFL
jgi:hypothetical protein